MGWRACLKKPDDVLRTDEHARAQEYEAYEDKEENVMRKIIEISIDDVKPGEDDVLKVQGISSDKETSHNVKRLLKRAIELFLKSAHPIGVISEISIAEFEFVYVGEGLNEKETPLDEIFRKADSLSLFVLTVGDRTSQKIDELFKSNEFALGSMLDSVASIGTDKAADVVENHYFNLLSKKGKIDSSLGILRYSPGYCGWHVSGQKKLFEFIHPEDIGITLLDSFVMKPLKSISGVMVAGKKEIHNFKDSYSFCKQCRTHSCRDRIKKLFRKSRSQNMKGAT